MSIMALPSRMYWPFSSKRKTSFGAYSCKNGAFTRKFTAFALHLRMFSHDWERFLTNLGALLASLGIIEASMIGQPLEKILAQDREFQKKRMRNQLIRILCVFSIMQFASRFELHLAVWHIGLLLLRIRLFRVFQIVRDDFCLFQAIL